MLTVSLTTLRSVVVDEALPLEVLEAVADCLKEDCRQIRQAVQDMQEEQQAIERMTAGKEPLADCTPCP